MLARSLKAVAASLFLLAASVLAADSGNASQSAVPNVAGDATLDPAKVSKYKALLNISASDTTFDEAFKWTDILDQYAPLNADCSDRCLTCAPGCSPACCAAGSSASSSSDDAGGKPDSSDRELPHIQFPRFPGSRFPGRPIIPPLACPCHCEDNCPRTIQTICCFTPGLRGRPGTPPAATVDAGANEQQSLLNSIHPATPPRNRIWGRPGRPLACPCFCEPSCPAYIQAICCTTPGTGANSRPDNPIVAAPKTHDKLALVAATLAGDPVAVLAAANLTVFDSFITLNLVQGLERAHEIVYNDRLRTFEVTLDLVAGPEGKETALTQTFVVIDGSLLLEEEQILLGAGFFSRLAGGVDVKKEFLTPLPEGLPVLTGVKHAEA